MALRRTVGNKNKPPQKPDVKDIKKVIPCDVICYRNMDTNPYSNLDVGDIFVEEQFVSTSVVESRALQKKFKLIIYVPKGSKAAYIESVSKFPTQREVLIDKGSIYRVISKKIL